MQHTTVQPLLEGRLLQRTALLPHLALPTTATLVGRMVRAFTFVILRLFASSSVHFYGERIGCGVLMWLAHAGYYYDPGSGYYYDANTGLYFNSSSQQWLALDPETGQFSVPQPANAVSSAAESTIGESTAFLP